MSSVLLVNVVISLGIHIKISIKIVDNFNVVNSAVLVAHLPAFPLAGAYKSFGKFWVW